MYNVFPLFVIVYAKDGVDGEAVWGHLKGLQALTSLLSQSTLCLYEGRIAVIDNMAF